MGNHVLKLFLMTYSSDICSMIFAYPWTSVGNSYPNVGYSRVLNTQTRNLVLAGGGFGLGISYGYFGVGFHMPIRLSRVFFDTIDIS